MITTLVLGAGASLAYGYPSGPDLITKIEEKLSEDQSSTAKEILTRLTTFRPESIDEFLNQFPKDAQFTKGVIAEILFECEDPYLKIPHKKDFYHSLCLKIPRTRYGEFKIITFNYDRHLEFSFLKFLQSFHNTFSKTAEELESLEIVHIHGRLPALPGEENFKLHNEREQYPYGFAKSGYGINTHHNADVLRAAFGYESEEEESQRTIGNAELEFAIDRRRQNIKNFGVRYFKFVHEGSEVRRAKEILNSSNRICFAGFSYHPLNMQYLGLDWGKTDTSKQIVGTTYNVPGRKKRRLLDVCKAITFKDCDAITFFEEYCDLENPKYDNFE